MKRVDKNILNIFLRYFTIILLGLGNLYLFYKILTPITIRTVQGILYLFYGSVQVIDNWILFNNISVEIIQACVSGAAFYLLFILIFSTSDIKPKNRFYLTAISFLIFFFFNIVRIIFLILIIGISYFETIHWIFWNLLSTVVVVFIWFYLVKKFNIKTIPIYSDIKYIKNITKKKKKFSKKKKSK